MSEHEINLIENTAQLVKVEKALVHLIERLEVISAHESKAFTKAIEFDNDMDELNLNPYALMCRMASNSRSNSQFSSQIIQHRH
jgi:hypothetical protein